MNKISGSIVNVLAAILALLILCLSVWGREAPQSAGTEEALRKTEVALREEALRKVEPQYPPIAKAARAHGEVKVEVVIDTKGGVISANVVSGHPLLRDSALTAARQWVFKPTVISGSAVKVSGILTFRYVLDAKDDEKTKKDVSLGAAEPKADPAEQLCNEAERLHKERKFEEAIGKFREAIRIRPDYAWAHYNMGMTSLDLRRYSDAETSCAKALSIRREELKRDGDGERDMIFENSMVCLGLAESYLGRYDDAIGHFRKVADLEKQMADVRVFLGTMLSVKGDREAAIVALKESITIKPSSSALFLLGEIYLEQSRRKEAIESYKRCLELEDGPYGPPSHYGLGIAFLRIGDKRSAMAEYRALKEMNNERAERLLIEINKQPR